MRAPAAAGSEMVRTSAITRRASISCMNRRSTAEPPDRNSSTRIPVSFSNSEAIFWAVATGVEVYQATAPSFFAAAMSTVSGVKDWATTGAAKARTSASTISRTPVSFTRPGRSAPAG
jgi:hypothetical protein